MSLLFSRAASPVIVRTNRLRYRSVYCNHRSKIRCFSSGDTDNGRNNEGALSERIAREHAHLSEIHTGKNIVDGKPTLEYARQMQTSYSAMTNTDIIHLCSEGDYDARKEALCRNIMTTDVVEYDQAVLKLKDIVRTNKNQMHAHHVPYIVGLVATLTAGTLSVPLVFHKDSVLWFNEHYVTMELPAPGDVETILEVGSFSWSWMEPIMGQISFFLLTLQFARNQLINIGIKPYGNFMKQYRASKLIQQYPQYDEKLLTDFAFSAYYVD